MQNIINHFKEIENQAASTLMQAMESRKKLEDAYKMMTEENEKNTEHTGVMVPFVAFETQLERFQEEKRELLDRHGEEKDKMRKHYQRIIIAMAVALASMIIGFFGTAIYIVANYDIATVRLTQDIDMNDGSATIDDGIEYNKNAPK